MNERRSIQDIVPPARSRPIRTMPDPEPPREPIQRRPDGPRRSSGGIMPFVWVALLTVIVLAAIVGLMSTVFHSANVVVTITESKTDISGTYDAGGEASLAYSPLTITDTRTRTVPASGTEDAKLRAEGTITIFNSYSTKTQRLITNTRFESASGKIYRIHAPVVVPGYTLVKGAKVPGQISATVYADEAGPEYNAETASFTIPGLKGSPQFTDMTAKSSSALSGGFIGTRAVVDKAVRDEAVLALKAELDRALRDAIVSKTPAGMSAFPDSAQLSFREGPDVASADGAQLSVTGTLVAPLFVSEDIARAVVERSGGDSSLAMVLKNPTEIGFTSASSTYQAGEPIRFTLSGIGHLGPVLDTEALKVRIEKKSRAELESIRREYRGVQSLAVTVYPFWLSTLPSAGGIDVLVVSSLDRTR